MRAALGGLLIVIWGTAALAGVPAVIQPYASNHFAVAEGKSFEFSIEVREPVEMGVAIATTDRDLVRELSGIKKYSPGVYAFAWDGTDAEKKPVPDEAYFPLLLLPSKPEITQVHPADYSGGEIVDPKTTLQPNGEVGFSIPDPARILVRAGIKSGPLMRTLSVWKPYPTGSNRIAWDGLDESGQVPVVQDKRFAVMATGYRLPDHAILVSGGRGESYAAWRKQKGWPESAADRLVGAALERDGKALSRVFFIAHYQPYDPPVMFSFASRTEPTPTLDDAVTVKVDIAPEHRAILESSQFEVAFFVDGEFVSEEEQGYVPFNWRFDPTKFGPGQHVLTVNVSGFTGQVGTASLLFKVGPLDAPVVAP